MIAQPLSFEVLPSSWPGLARPSTSSFARSKTWMPGTRPGMTKERDIEATTCPPKLTSEGGSNPSLRLWRYGLLRGACRRVRIRATRWLAMMEEEHVGSTKGRRTAKGCAVVSRSPSILLCDPGFALGPPGRLRHFGRIASAVPWMKACSFGISSSFSLPVKSGMPRSRNGPLNTMSFRLVMLSAAT